MAPWVDQGRPGAENSDGAAQVPRPLRLLPKGYWLTSSVVATFFPSFSS